MSRLVSTSRPIAASNEYQTFSATRIVDNNANTQWKSEVNANNCEFILDLVSKHEILRVEVKWSSLNTDAFAKNVILSVTDSDDTTWVPIRTIENTAITVNQFASENNSINTIAVNRITRFIKLSIDTRVPSSNPHFVIRDLLAYGYLLEQFPNSLLSLNAPAKSNIDEDATVQFVTDNASNTYWVSNGIQGEEFVYIDLGRNLEVKYLNVSWFINYAQSFAIDTSVNSFIWTNLGTYRNEFLMNSTDINDKWNKFVGLSNGTNVIDVNLITRFIRLRPLEKALSTITTCNVSKFNAFGRPASVPISPALPSIPEEHVTRPYTLKRGTSSILFDHNLLKDFIFKHKNMTVFPSVYPSDPGSTYSLNVKSITSSIRGVQIQLNESIPISIDVTVLVSTKRRTVHVSIPPSNRLRTVDYVHDISALAFQSDKKYVVEPVVRDNMAINATVEFNTLKVHIEGTPWNVHFPIRISIFEEPHSFNSSHDIRLITQNETTYTLPETFNTDNVKYKGTRVENEIYNFVPILSTIEKLTLTAGTPIRVPNDTQEGDMIALDTTYSGVSFHANTVGARLEPFVTSTTSKTVYVTVTIYRRAPFEKSITLSNTTHDYKFINKNIDIIDSPSIRNVDILQSENNTKIDLYGTNPGTIRFNPVDVNSDNETLLLSQLSTQDVLIKATKAVGIQSDKGIFFDKLDVRAEKTIIGNGRVLEFVINNTGSSPVISEYPSDVSGLKPDVYIVKTGDAQSQNYAEFMVTINQHLLVQHGTLSVTGFTNKNIKLNLFVPYDIEVPNTIQVKKFVGTSGSSVSIDGATSDEVASELYTSNVNVAGVILSEDLGAHSIKTRNMFTESDVDLSVNADKITISSKDVHLAGNITIFRDDLRVSMDDKFTLLDTNSDDVIVGRDVHLTSDTHNLNLIKFDNSTLPSRITLDTAPNTKNIYDYTNIGKVNKVGTLLTNYTSDPDVKEYVLTYDPVHRLDNQEYINKLTNVQGYVISEFGKSLPEISAIREGTLLRKVFRKDNIVRRETYLLYGDTNVTEGEVAFSANLSYRPKFPIESTETHTDSDGNTNIHYKVSQAARTYDRVHIQSKNGVIVRKVEFLILLNSIKARVTEKTRAPIRMHNIVIGELLHGNTTDGELVIEGNIPKMVTETETFITNESELFFETNDSTSGLRTIHGTYIDTTSDSISATVTKNTIKSTFQDEEKYDSSFIDTGILELTDTALLVFSYVNGQITSADINTDDILPGTYTNSSITVKFPEKTVTSNVGFTSGSNERVYVRRNPKIRPHGRHNEYSNQTIENVNLSKTGHTASNVHTTSSVYDIRYIGPQSILDFYCEGIWYPQLKISDTQYVDTHIEYLSGTENALKTITDVIVNPYLAKESVEKTGISLIYPTRTPAILDSNVSLTNYIRKTPVTERKTPVENVSNLAWINGKSTDSLDHGIVLRTMLAYTTLFDESEDIEDIIQTLSTRSPSARTTRLRKALFDVSPISVAFDKYVNAETQKYTRTDNNWSNGLSIVGDKYISEIKDAILETEGISNNQLNNLIDGHLNEGTFNLFYGSDPVYTGNMTHALVMDGIVKQPAKPLRPGRWVKVGNTVWITADIHIPSVVAISEYTYTVVGNPFEKLVRGSQIKDAYNTLINSDTYEIDRNNTTTNTTPSMIPEFTLDTSKSPNNKYTRTVMRTDGTISVSDHEGSLMKLNNIKHMQHKFAGTFQIVEPQPESEYETYTIPQNTDISSYGYSLDDGGNQTFAGYKLKATSAPFNNGIYSS